MNKETYFYQDESGHWTFQCPHEGFSDVFIIKIDKGEMVLCTACANKINDEVNKNKKEIVVDRK